MRETPLRLEGYAPRVTSAGSARRGHPDGPTIYHDAVEVLRSEYAVTNAVAYSMLVQASVEAGTTVRAAATKVVEDARARR